MQKNIMLQMNTRLSSKMCTGKNRYRSKTAVFKTGRIEMKIRLNQKQLYAYQCPICTNWHLTHNSMEVDVKKFKIK